MMMGRVDEVDGNFVATRFIALIVPAGTFYVNAVPSRTATSPGLMRLKTSAKSIALAYARAWLPASAIALLVTSIAPGGPRIAAAAVAAALVVASVLAHRAGRLGEGAKARLRLLGSVTGLRVDPAMLVPATRDAKRASLQALMVKAGIPASADGILSVLEEIPIPALPLVYGYARYAGDDPAWRTCAARVYARHEQALV